MQRKAALQQSDYEFEGAFYHLTRARLLVNHLLYIDLE